MTGTPIPAGVLTVDDEPNVWGRFYVLDLNGWCVGEVTDKQRARLLAGPPRPDGVPDWAVPVNMWIGHDQGDASAQVWLGNGTPTDFLADVIWFRDVGVPVPPYRPAPDPEALLVEKITADWTHPDPADSPTGLVATPLTYTPPVAGERTGPLGLSEGDTRDAARWLLTSADTPVIPLIEACRAAVAEWDAEPQPAETLTDIVAWLRNRAASPDSTWSRLADRIEAASRPDSDTIPVNRDHFHNLGVVASIAHEFAAAMAAIERPDPDPDTITVNLPAHVVRGVAAGSRWWDDVIMRACALAAAGLPQEPTAVQRRPSREEQRAHLDEGSCGCHDSWDQCPCAEGGHPADGSCNCCPLGTGLCGPLPQEPTEGGQS